MGLGDAGEEGVVLDLFEDDDVRVELPHGRPDARDVRLHLVARREALGLAIAAASPESQCASKRRRTFHVATTRRSHDTGSTWGRAHPARSTSKATTTGWPDVDAEEGDVSISDVLARPTPPVACGARSSAIRDVASTP